MCQDKERMGTLIGGHPLVLSDSQKDSIKCLKEKLRNKFEHRIPGVWFIEMRGLPRISMDILEIIRFLAVETFRYQHLNQAQRKKVTSIVFQTKKILKQSPLHLELLEAESGNQT